MSPAEVIKMADSSLNHYRQCRHCSYFVETSVMIFSAKHHIRIKNLDSISGLILRLARISKKKTLKKCFLR